MPKDREGRAPNPAQAQRKLEKQKAVKKGKAEAQARRQEKLARRNPERLERRIEELEASGEARNQRALEELRREVGAVRKAREALGSKRGDGATSFVGRGGASRTKDVLGKRRRHDDDGRGGGGRSESSETDESVRAIPMPRDTPPPIPPRRGARVVGNANLEPLGQGRGGGQRLPHALPPKPEGGPAAVVKTVYEAKPVVRDLRKEAVSKFVPAVVQRKIGAGKGRGKLLEPEEMDKLEEEGYTGDRRASGQHVEGGGGTAADAVPAVDDVDRVGNAGGGGGLEEEEERFERELRSVQMEEVEDEDR